METLVQLGSYSILSPPLINLRTLSSKGHSSFLSNNLNLLSLRTATTRRPLMMVVQARKGRKGKEDKNDNNSNGSTFRIKPDDSTGPFPEAVLLKKKVVQEDGKALPDFADEEEAKLYQELNLKLESQMNIEKKRHYEVVYLIHENHVEKVDEVNSIVKAFVEEKQGKIWRFCEWGFRRLAYSIKKTTHAYYVLMNFEIPNKWVNDFKSLLDEDERIIRHLVMKRDKAEVEVLPPPPEYHTLMAQWNGEYEEDEDEEDEEGYEDEEDEDEEGYEDEEEYEDEDEEDEDEEGYEDEEDEYEDEEDEEDEDEEGYEDDEEELDDEDEEDVEGYEDEEELSDEDEQDIEDYEDDEDEESYDEDDEEKSNDEDDKEFEIEEVSRREVKQKEDQKTVSKVKRKNIFKLAKILR